MRRFSLIACSQCQYPNGLRDYIDHTKDDYFCPQCGLHWEFDLIPGEEDEECVGVKDGRHHYDDTYYSCEICEGFGARLLVQKDGNTEWGAVWPNQYQEFLNMIKTDANLEHSLCYLTQANGDKITFLFGDASKIRRYLKHIFKSGTRHNYKG